MAILRLKKHDINTLQDVLRLFYNSQSNQEQMIKYLSDDKNYILIHKEDQQVTGFAYGYELQRFDGKKNMLYVHQVEVLPEFRNQGIGKQLMQEFIKLASLNKCGRIFLITNKSNESAINLYRSVKGKTPSEDDIVFVIEDYLNTVDG